MDFPSHQRLIKWTQQTHESPNLKDFKPKYQPPETPVVSVLKERIAWTVQCNIAQTQKQQMEAQGWNDIENVKVEVQQETNI